jgi:hypothetical protein
MYCKSARSLGVKQLMLRIESGVLTPFVNDENKNAKMARLVIPLAFRFLPESETHLFVFDFSTNNLKFQQCMTLANSSK